MSLVLLTHFSSVMDAEVAVATLKAAGINTVLQKDGIPGSIGLIQGADLFVSENDLETAHSILDL